MFLTNYSEDKILRTFLGTTCVAPTQFYAALLLSNPGEQGAGTEITYTGYSRMPISFSIPTITTAGAEIKNVSDISFATSNGSYGSVSYVGLYDSITGGNMWAYIIPAEPIEVLNGVAPLIQAQSWHYNSSGNLSNAYKEKLLNLFRGVSLPGFTPYFALYNGNPDSGGSELSGGAYNRFKADFSTPSEQPNGQMMISVSADTSSPRSIDNWGTYSYTAICDAASAGEVVAFKEREDSIIMSKGKAVIVRTDEFSFSLT